MRKKWRTSIVILVYERIRSQKPKVTPIEHPEREPRLNGLPELNGVNKEAQKGNF